MDGKTIFDALKNTVVDKVVGKASEIMTKQKETPQQPQQDEGSFDSGLYFRSYKGEFSGLSPEMDFFEPQRMNMSLIKMFKNMSLSSAQSTFYKGCRALVCGLSDKACEFFRRSLEKDPQLSDAYFMLGFFDWKERKCESAAENFQKALLLHGSLGKTIKPALPSFRLLMPVTSNLSFAFYPDLIGASAMLAVCRRSGGVDDPAEGLSRILDLLPGQSAISFLLAVILYEQGKREEITKILGNLPLDTPNAALNMLILGKVHSESGQPDKGLEICERALASETLEPDLRKDFESLSKICKAQSKGKTVEGTGLTLMERLGIRPGATVPKPRGGKAVRSKTDDSRGTEIFYLDCPSKGKKYRLYNNMTIGKNGCDLDLPWDERLTERHAVVTESGGKWKIAPESDDSNVMVNGHRLSRASSLNIGDEIVIGSTNFEFRQTKKHGK